MLIISLCSAKTKLFNGRSTFQWGFMIDNHRNKGKAGVDILQIGAIVFPRASGAIVFPQEAGRGAIVCPHPVKVQFIDPDSAVKCNCLP